MGDGRGLNMSPDTDCAEGGVGRLAAEGASGACSGASAGVVVGGASGAADALSSSVRGLGAVCAGEAGDDGVRVPVTATATGGMGVSGADGVRWTGPDTGTPSATSGAACWAS